MSKQKRSVTRSRFELEEMGETAYLEFDMDSAGWITLLHTEVPEALRGRGIAGRTGEDGTGICTRQPIEGGRGVSAGCELHFKTPRVSAVGGPIIEGVYQRRRTPNTSSFVSLLRIGMSAR